MKQSSLTRLIIFRLIPVTLGVLALLIFVGGYERPWPTIVINMVVISAFIYWNALSIKKLDEARTDALQLKIDFTSLVSHELRTPLAVIKGAIGVVADGADGPVTDAQKNRLEIATRTVDRLNRLVSNILDYQKLEGGHVSLTMISANLGNIIQETICDFTPVAVAKGVSLIEEIQPNVQPVTCDDDAIVQVLTNLLNNAIKFSDHGTIVVGCKVEGRNAVVSVKDDGIGIRETDIPKLFQSFRQIPRSDHNNQGTGLGLFISRKIVEHHGGRIWVKSVFGQGSTFYFTVPLSPEKS